MGVVIPASLNMASMRPVALALASSAYLPKTEDSNANAFGGGDGGDVM